MTDALFEQLKHPNPHMRERAMLQLAEERTAETIPRLMAILDEENVEYRRAAVLALGVIGVDSVPSLVEAMLNSDDPTVRSSCAKSLAQISLNHPEVSFPESGMQALKTAMSDENPVVHIAAVMALGQIGAPALDILVETLKTTDNLTVSVAILNALGSLGDPRAADILAQLSTDETVDPYVRESATSALSRLQMVGQYQTGGHQPT